LHFKQEKDKETRLHKFCPLSGLQNLLTCWEIFVGWWYIVRDKYLLLIQPPTVPRAEMVDRLVNIVAERMVE
jgi:hypothetical protein